MAGGTTLRREFHSVGEPFNWNRHEVIDNLLAMCDELPIGASGLDLLASRVLAAEAYSACDIVSACIA